MFYIATTRSNEAKKKKKEKNNIRFDGRNGSPDSRRGVIPTIVYVASVREIRRNSSDKQFVYDT